MLYQARKHYGNTLYTMHFCENMHLEIFKKMERYLKDISTKYSSNIYTDIFIHVIDIHFMS